ncbi:hypothetical protein IC620_10235 [Hazenella sp. IB182357]|uniref:Uncharacterized protein n=1 Tax=Polycladospora coralii TaxID=2771432 RepID=A0A926RUS3_9BACL|nr:hypothetical protein [Polycladospora coralii]MBD1372734.1 hypothetical protein [Polycladospora coralii]MBS7531125.1 hypothetical protein [Polycladospora coralii]
MFHSSKRNLTLIVMFLSICLVYFIQQYDLSSVFSQKEDNLNIQMVKNEGNYESYIGSNPIDFFVLNLAFNHDSSLNITTENTVIELLPKTNIVDLSKFRIKENPPQREMSQKALYIDLQSRMVGTHTFNKIKIKTNGLEKVLDLGELNVHIRKGEFSNLLVMSKEIGIFPVSQPLNLSVKNSNEHAVIIKDIVLNSHYIDFEKKDIQVVKNDQIQQMSEQGFKLEPDQTVDLSVNWKVNFPSNQKMNIEARPIVVSEYNNEEQYAGIANMVFRNDFK